MSRFAAIAVACIVAIGVGIRLVRIADVEVPFAWLLTGGGVALLLIVAIAIKERGTGREQ